ncbi:MAG TPA: AAA family ATPase [Acidimicrobiia bacterium]|nr:AAA family ATPase [Acidimicrobiia bacterium]
MPTSWPLVGRTAELAAVAAAMDAGGGGVLLSGPAGVGKTRLATECLELAEARRWSTGVVRANQAVASIPYGAFAPQLPRAFRSAQGEADALRQAAHAILARAGEGRLLLVVDDAHELDDGSAALLHLLAGSPPVFLVVTVRAGPEPPAAVTALWKDELLERIDVAELDGTAAAELVAVALGGPVDGGTAQALWRASGGNALFLRELVIGAQDAGALRDVGGLWRLRGQLSPSTRLGEVVGLRLGRLSDGEREAVELVAVGEPVSLDDLLELARVDCVDDLERRELLEVQPEGQRRQVRMAHPLYAEVVRAGLPGRRRQELLGRLAVAVEGRGARRREDVLRIAVWRVDAGGGGRPDLLSAAARQALAAQDLRLAVRLAEAARAAGAGADAAQVLGMGLDGLGDHERAETVLAAGEREAIDPGRRAELSMARADNLFRGLGRADEAEGVLQAAELALDDPSLRDGLVGLRGTCLVFEGRLNEALELLEPLLAEGADLADAHGAIPGAVALALAGRTEEASALARRGREARERLGERVQLGAPGVYLVAEAQALLEAGRMADAAVLAQLGYEGALDVGAHHGQAWFAAILARIDLHRGRAASAARWGQESGVVFRELRHPSARWGFGALAGARALAGDLDGAEAAFAEIDAEPPTPVRVFDPEIARGRAWLAAQRGERTRAREILEEAAAQAERGGARTIAAGAIHDLARLGDAASALDGLERVASPSDSAYVVTRRDHVRALVAEDGDGLDAAAARFEALGAALLAAEAASAAATLHARAALRRKAAASARHAAALLAGCEGARPFIAVPDLPGFGLTPREREVAELAAQDLTSREIAEQLVLSARTVENHLQRAYEKLGVGGRRELREALASGTEPG